MFIVVLSVSCGWDVSQLLRVSILCTTALKNLAGSNKINSSNLLGQAGRILAKFFILRVYGPQFRLGP